MLSTDICLSAVPREVEASYSAIIDDILASSDLETVSAKRIRKGLQEKVDYDISPQKVSVHSLAQVTSPPARHRDPKSSSIKIY